MFLHHVLDKRFEAEVRPRLRGRCQLMRYADDAVMIFADEPDSSGGLQAGVMSPIFLLSRSNA